MKFIPLVIGLLLVHTLSAQEAPEQQQKAWLKTLNKGNDLIDFYPYNCGLLWKDSLYIDRAVIDQKYQAWKKAAKKKIKYTQLGVYEIRPNQKFILGKYTSGKSKSYLSAIGWSLKDDFWQKELEVLYEMDENTANNLDHAGISKALQQWEDFSNAHQPDRIAEQLCLPNGYYFNNGRKYVGPEIKEIYSYMNNPKWKIKLASDKVAFVDESLAYDIGTYQSTGKGQYILIWKKVDGEWRILLDFNF
ncbi:MAG: nuclear transport factor 2 family protein [Bacteroidota bacterium]